MPWTCSACSYSDNIDARTRCALCDAQKPANAARAPVAPSGPKWACGFCTLENPGSAPSCMACGQPKPAAFQATRSAPPAQPIPANIAAAAAAARPAAATAAAKPAAATASKPAAAAPAPAAKPTATAPAAKPTAVAASSAAKPAAPAAAAGGPSEDDIKFIESMGFTRAKAIQGLTAKKNDREQALDYLLGQDAEASKPKPAATAAKPAAATTAPAAKPAAAAPAAKPVAATAATAAKPAAAAAPSAAANAVIAPLKQLTMDEKKALEQREAKRLELLKQMEEERAAKAKAKIAAAAPAATAAKPAAAAKPATAAVPRATSSSSVPVSASSVPVAAKEEPPTKELSAEEKKLAKIAEERAAEAERKQIAALRLAKRLESEKKLKDIPTVCRTLQHNYDAIRYESMIVLLRKIIDKIVEDKGVNEKFRKINLNNPKIELNLSRPIGPIWILKQAGFEEIVEQPSSSSMSDVDTFDGAGEEQRHVFLPSKKVDLAKLQSVSHALKQQLAVHSSHIPAVFNEIVSSNRYDLESVYHLALELRLLVQNIIVSTDEVDQIREHMNQSAADADNAMSDSSSSSSSAARRAKADGLNKNFRTIDKEESFYVHRIKPIKESRKILQELGFELDSHDLTKRFLVVPYERVSGEQNIKRYQVILREIQAFIRSIENSTPIAVALTHLCSKNRQKPTEKFIEIFSEAVRLVIANPHEQKFHKIVLNKVQNKIGTKPNQIVQGMEEFVKLFGFERRNDEVDPAGALVSPATIRSLSDDNMTDVSPPAASSSSSSAPSNGQTVRVALQYPGFDVEQLSWRSAELERVWNQLKEKAAAEQGKADGWSFE